MSDRRPTAVIVLAAGEGTRMKSTIPKVLHTIGGRSLVGHALRAARGVEPLHLAVVVRHERDRVAAHIVEHDEDALVVDQDEVKGTGRAVECALEALPGEPGEFAHGHPAATGGSLAPDRFEALLRALGVPNGAAGPSR